MYHCLRIEIKRRIFWSFIYQVEPLFAVADAFFIFSGIFIKEQREEIDIVFEKIRNEVIRMLRFFQVDQSLSALEFKLDDLFVSVPAAGIEVEDFLAEAKARQEKKKDHKKG